MVTLSVSDIAKQWKLSRPTIQKRLKSGELSGVKDDNGKWQIDASEVVRCFGEPVNDAGNESVKVATPLHNDLTRTLQNQVELLTGQLDVKDRQINEVNQANRDLVNQLAAQTRLLEDRRPQTGGGLLGRFFGRPA